MINTGISSFYEDDNHNKNSIFFCDRSVEEIQVLQRHLNFTGLYVTSDPEIALQFSPPDDTQFGITSRNLWSGDLETFVLYCGPHDLSDRSLSNWMKPFKRNVWIAIVIVFIVSSLRGGHYYEATWHLNLSRVLESSLETSYFLLSLLMRQPIRAVTQKDIPFTLITLLIPWCYEGTITGSLIAPSKPYRFKDVGDFINSSKTVVGYSKNLFLSGDITKFSPVFSRVLERHGVPLHKIKDSFHIIETNEYVREETFTQWENLSRVGYIDRRVTNYVATRMESLQVFVDMIHRSDGKYICDKFPFGHSQTSFSFFGFALSRRASEVHANLLEFGIPLYWDSVWLYYAKLKHLKRRRWEEKENYIELKHLKGFLVTSAVVLLAWGVVFMVEYRKRAVHYAIFVFGITLRSVKIMIRQIVRLSRAKKEKVQNLAGI